MRAMCLKFSYQADHQVNDTELHTIFVILFFDEAVVLQIQRNWNRQHPTAMELNFDCNNCETFFSLQGAYYDKEKRSSDFERVEWYGPT